MSTSRASADGEANPRLTGRDMIEVWDPVVRIFHWGVVIGCILNLFILPEGKTLHRYVGYVIVGLLSARLVWGFVGTQHARFWDFFPTPGRLRAYVTALASGEETRTLGHSPLAALMMLTLMFLLALTAATGFAMTLDAFWGLKWLESLHGLLANSILVLSGIHVLAAIVESLRHRENLVWSMITGRKRTVI